MTIALTVLAGIFGCIVGSFLHVIAVRMNTGKTLGGRSHCFACRKQLHWYELIPVVSFLIQKGKCRSCLADIHPRYIATEIITGLAFAGIVYKYAMWLVLTPQIVVTVGVLFAVFSLLITLSLYDFRHMIVPDALVWPLIIISFLSLFFSISPGGLFLIQFTLRAPELWHFLAGIILPLPFFCAWLFSRGRLMGFGDIKLMVAIGWFAGLLAGASAIIFAFWSALIFVVIILISQQVFQLFPYMKKFIMKTEVPFAPFLGIGLYLVMVCEITLLLFL